MTGFGAPSLEAARARATSTRFAGRAVFERVLDQVLEQPQQFLAIARDRHRLRGQIDLDFDPRSRASGSSPSATWRTIGTISTSVFGPDMGRQFDPRQRQQIVDQPRHPRRLRPA